MVCFVVVGFLFRFCFLSLAIILDPKAFLLDCANRKREELWGRDLFAVRDQFCLRLRQSISNWSKAKVITNQNKREKRSEPIRYH